MISELYSQSLLNYAYMESANMIIIAECFCKSLGNFSAIH